MQWNGYREAHLVCPDLGSSPLWRRVKRLSSQVPLVFGKNQFRAHHLLKLFFTDKSVHRESILKSQWQCVKVSGSSANPAWSSSISYVLFWGRCSAAHFWLWDPEGRRVLLLWQFAEERGTMSLSPLFYKGLSQCIADEGCSINICWLNEEVNDREVELTRGKVPVTPESFY